VRWNADVIGAERRDHLLAALGATGDLADAITQLRSRLKLPAGLREEGVTEADIPKLADKAFEDACHRSNPRPVTRDDLAALYRASL
jgi:alcohol dehydrogenase class IV